MSFLSSSSSSAAAGSVFLASCSLALSLPSPQKRKSLWTKQRTECIPPREIPVVPTRAGSTLNSFVLLLRRPSPSPPPPFPSLPPSTFSSVPTKNSQSKTRCRSQQLSIKKGRSCSSAPSLRKERTSSLSYRAKSAGVAAAAAVTAAAASLPAAAAASGLSAGQAPPSLPVPSLGQKGSHRRPRVPK